MQLGPTKIMGCRQSEMGSNESIKQMQEIMDLSYFHGTTI